MTLAAYSAEEVEAALDYPGCIAAVREAMITLATREKDQPLRQIVTLGPGEMFGVMPGRLMSSGLFGAKLVSVFGDSSRPGRSRHQGLVVAYSASDGAVAFVADAEAVTRIRTGCASAAATDALARADAEILAVLGTGTQAEAHIRAVSLVRPFRELRLWGRSIENAARLAERLQPEIAVPIRIFPDVGEAVSKADVICTVSSASEPILRNDQISPGTHLNLVGSSHLGPSEVDSALVAASRYIADCRPSVLAQAAEFDIARRAGLVDDDHVAGEIGEVYAGTLDGRRDGDEITLYKSLGHIVQDLAAADYLHRKLTAARFG